DCLAQCGFVEPLAESFAARTTADALDALAAAGVPCAAARQPADLAADPCLQGLDVFTPFEMQDGTPFHVTNRYAQFSRTQERAVFVAPGLGEHSRKLLEDAGVPTPEIESLLAAGAIKQGTPFRVAAIQN